MSKVVVLRKRRNFEIQFPVNVVATDCTSHTHSLVKKGRHGVTIKHLTFEGGFCSFKCLDYEK